MAKSPAVGRPSTALVPGTPTPSATTPTFFLCCESSKGCRRRVRRSQALEDGPQLLLRPPGYAAWGWIVSASSPSGSGGPPRAASSSLPPKQLGGGGAATEGLTGREQWRQDSRVLPHGHHMSLTARSTAPSPWVVGLLPHPPDAFLQALLERIQTGEGREERSKNQHSSCCPIHHCPSAFCEGPQHNPCFLPSSVKTQVAEWIPDSFI